MEEEISPEQEKMLRNTKILFVSVIFILIFTVIYFAIWRGINSSLRDSINEMIKNSATFDSVEYSGFPFKKIIKIKNLSLSSPAKNTQVLVKNVVLHSGIFASEMNLDFENIRIIQDKKSYNIIYNEKPTSVINFYSDGRLNYFNYADNGYNVIDSETNQLFSSSELETKIDSVRNGNSIDYAFSGGVKNIKTATDIAKSPESSNDSYSFSFDGDLIVDKDENGRSSVDIEIKTASLLKNEKEMLSVKGNVKSGGKDKIAYGNITVTAQDYKKMLEDLEKEAIKIIKEGEVMGKKLTKEEQKSHIFILAGVLSSINDIIEKSPQTKKGISGVISLSREANSVQYFINGENLNNFINALFLSVQSSVK
ncbi:MAG: hypothetical protein LBC92_01880 [Rickettsiales bacterium]|jgi:hypothetical protein|nr:hypothetical protein [Rickettsiales bacterium]